MPRAYGSNAQLLLGFESVYGIAPASGFYQVPFISGNLGTEQELIENDVLGYGRDPIAGMQDVINGGGDIIVPVDVRNFGLWLTGLLGAPVSGDNYASGFIRFSANPAADDTITLNGVAFTFVSGAPMANEIEIGADLDATLENAVTVLNASSDPDVAEATYSHISGSKDLDVVHDTAGASGDAFTLAASAAEVSGDTLTGGSAKRHVFKSGAASLPSVAMETGLKDVPAYYMNAGVVINSMRIEFVRSGGAKATFNCLSQSEVKYDVSQGGSPTIFEYTRFNQFQGCIKKDGLRLGNVVSGSFTFTNNYEAVENLRPDGLIDGADPTQTAMTGDLKIRFASSDLMDLASSGTPMAMEFSYVIDNTKQLIVSVQEVRLPKPKIAI
ncbi:MAG: phage tail tube protein, partial [Candidatus Hinthialibacter sp.]